MASEIRVDKINSLSGVGTVTLSPTGVDIAGITTAATLRATTGIVTSLTAGSLTSLGAVSGTTGTFSGAVSGTTGTFTGDLTIPDKIVHTGDTDTSIRLGVDTVTVETGGSERVRIDSSGNFGVGTNSPATLLHSNLAAENGSIAQFGLSGQTNNQSFIIKADDSDSLFTFRFGSTNSTYPAVRFNMGADVEAMRIDSSGRLLIGTTTEGHAEADDLTIATTGDTGITIRSGTSSNGNIFFSDGTSGDAEYQGYLQYEHTHGRLNFATEATPRLKIDGANVNIVSGNLKFETAGKGIDFSATSNSGGGVMSNELFDDYEEGTFTPTFAGGISASSYYNQYGFYTKIGDQVFVYVYIRANSATTSSSNIQVSGLPYTCNSTAGKEGGGYMTYTNGFFGTTVNDEHYHPMPWVSLGTAYAIFHSPSDGNNITGSDTVPGNKYCIFHLRYAGV